MKDRKLFENLDTSFVKLEALVRHLCRLKFVGTLSIVFEDFRGEIKFNSKGKLRVNEYDRGIAPSRTGPEALKQILIRAEEPGGTISVFESDDRYPIDSVVLADLEPANEPPSKLIRHVHIINKEPDPASQARTVLAKLAEFPFELANNFEEEAAFPADTDIGLELMIDVTSDLLSTIDGALESGGLNFSAAFEKACGDVANKYPYLDPEKLLFRYGGGLVYISADVNLRSFPSGLGEALQRIFNRLAASSKFADVHDNAVEKVRSLAATRKDEFNRTGVLRHIEKALGGSVNGRSS